MGLFGGTKTTNTKYFERFLTEGEEIEAVYRLVIDEMCFTNKRIIFFDRNAFSTKKGKVSIPYRSVSHFMIEDDGLLDRDIAVKFIVHNEEFILRFSKGCDFIELEKLLTYYICD